MPARTLFVGLDAVDATLVARFGAEGGVERLASLSRDAAAFQLSNPLGTIGGGVWEELINGRSCGRAGVFFPGRQLHAGEAVPRPVEKQEVDPRAFWTIASDFGKRVAVIDVPHSVAPPELNGVFAVGWGTHDRFYGTESVPDDFLEDLSARHGDYPLWSRPWPRRTTAACDGHDGSPEQYEELLDDLLAGVERKAALLLDILGREEWDLFACGLSEGHCSGHQLWHFLDEAPPRGHERLTDGIRMVYERLSAAVGRLMDAAEAESTVVVASHSFANPTGGHQLIPEALIRLGYGSGQGAAVRARSRVPPGVRRLVRRVLPRRATRTLQARVGTLPRPLASPLTKAAALDSDDCVWIRLNVKGREPHGSVEPGPEAEAILSDIRSELLLLEDPDTGEPIVKQVLSAVEAFGDGYHPDVPDLMITFRTDLGVLDACRSDRVGVIRVPLSLTARRTGAHPHRPTQVWMSGRTIPRSTQVGGGRAVDLPPTILSLLGVPPAEWLEGASLLPVPEPMR
jgi:predicted AlkP superfamily phosphohydrolase/phosphomutase